jgi:surface antigen
MIRNKLAIAFAAIAIYAAPVSAQPNQGSQDRGNFQDRRDNNGPGQNRSNDGFGRYDGNNYGPPPPSANYRQGYYEQNCRRGDNVAGTVFGAIAGGLLGGGVSHGNGGAVIGGAILGGLLGNTISGDIDCNDQPYAFRTYAEGLNGDIGRRYEWRHGAAYGQFMPRREYRRGGMVCRDFTETSYRARRPYKRNGTACRGQDGYWRFD